MEKIYFDVRGNKIAGPNGEVIYYQCDSIGGIGESLAIQVVWESTKGRRGIVVFEGTRQTVEDGIHFFLQM